MNQMKSLKTITAIVAVIFLAATIGAGCNKKPEVKVSEPALTRNPDCYSSPNKTWQILVSNDNWTITAPKGWKLVENPDMSGPKMYILQIPGTGSGINGEVLRSGLQITVETSEGKNLKSRYSQELTSGNAKIVSISGTQVIQSKNPDQGGMVYSLEKAGRVVTFDTSNLREDYLSLVPDMISSFGDTCAQDL